MKKKTTISFVIPFKSRFDFLRDAIISIYNQKNLEDVDLEIFIIEEKNSQIFFGRQLQKEFPKISPIVNIYEEGPGGSRQTGLEKAKGEFIIFLDSDDVLEPLFISKLSETLKRNPKTAAVVCFSEARFEKGFKLKYKIKLYPLMLVRDLSLWIAYFINKGNLFLSAFYLCQLSHMMFRSSFIKKLRFDYRYRRGGEDCDFNVKVLQHNPIRIIPSRLLKFRYSPKSATYQSVQLDNKWNSFNTLANNLPDSFKKGLYYYLFLLYIKIFRTVSSK
jgi:cellulose synthase/poly-beta-1,6-N-acetylglucosamine synthase-like glycosyltransferase